MNSFASRFATTGALMELRNAQKELDDADGESPGAFVCMSIAIDS